MLVGFLQFFFPLPPSTTEIEIDTDLAYFVKYNWINFIDKENLILAGQSCS